MPRAIATLIVMVGICLSIISSTRGPQPEPNDSRVTPRLAGVWTPLDEYVAPTTTPPPPVPQTAPQEPERQIVVTPPPTVAPNPVPTPIGDIWAQLAACESGGNPATNTGNGFYGAFQFTLATWQGLGMGGLPSEASYDVQLGAAQALQARSGWGPWPACARKLGLT